jgi:FAD/FMN-containing dehydrogenase
LNATRVSRIEAPTSLAELQHFLRESVRESRPFSIAGGRHAMGGQAFLSDGVLLDTRGLNRILGFDADRGLVEAEAGIMWPALIDFLIREQAGRVRQWAIVQKQTGADDLTLGGSLAANIHSRGLALRPIIQDVEAFTLVTPVGELRRCSREENPELFSLVIGGYGLFGVVYSVTLRLWPRRKVRRVVEVLDIDALMPAFAARIADGYLYGDWQYHTDERSEHFLRRGLLSCYVPVADDTPIPEEQLTLNVEQWRDLVHLGHVDKTRAYEVYTRYYLASSGQAYWSDTHQIIPYDVGYHALLDHRLGAQHPGSEVISELFVPRDRLGDFLAAARDDFRQHGVNVVYGTVRLIEPDEESFLSWARRPYAGTIFNLHVDHTPVGIEHAAAAFRRLIDLALRWDGTYFPTYHRWATRQQVLAAHPRFPEFLRRKLQYDPGEVIQSDWYRHHVALLAARDLEPPA